ncbi:hypothetical protein DR102_00305 [Mycoplasma hyorhinis]|uniref:hypothetical protein n=1 Tax=Mesomycoplasma hyorhinis TaxID=2100 RepID=UPI0013701F21|nr:hypothetical protein [Mesomycoplasma hyorhinis]MXR06243.1 hypothetical protein [Mesomycoplasma hyorhinis]
MKSIFSKKLLFLSVSTITLVSSVLISCQENSQTTTKNQQTTSSQKPSQNSSKSSQANIIKELTTLNKNVVDNELKPILNENLGIITQLAIPSLSYILKDSLQLKDNNSDSENNNESDLNKTLAEFIVNPKILSLLPKILQIQNDYSSKLKDLEKEAALTNENFQQILKEQTQKKIEVIITKLSNSDFKAQDLPNNASTINSQQDFELAIENYVTYSLVTLLNKNKQNIEEEVGNSQGTNIIDSSILKIYKDLAYQLTSQLKNPLPFIISYFKKLYPNPTATDVDKFTKEVLAKTFENTVNKFLVLLDV